MENGVEFVNEQGEFVLDEGASGVVAGIGRDSARSPGARTRSANGLRRGAEQGQSAIALTKLKQIHSATHSGARLSRQVGTDDAHQEPAAVGAQAEPAAEREALLSSLAAEAVEEDLDAERAGGR